MRSDLRYQWTSRYGLYATACCVIAAAAFAAGSFGTARAAINSLHQEWEFLRSEGGYTFPRAIGQGVDPTDSPLKDTWEEVGQAVAGLQVIQGTVSVIQALTFVIAPVLFFTYGAIAATRDRHYGTLKFRATREGHTRMFFSKLACTAAFVTGLAAASLIGSLIISYALSRMSSGRLDDPLVTVPCELSPFEILLPLAVLILTGLVFALLGMGTATLIPHPLYVIPAFCVGFFVLPVLGRLDPRNLLMALAYPHMKFLGSFTPVPPDLVPEPIALLALAAPTGALLTAACAASARRSKFTT